MSERGVRWLFLIALAAQLLLLAARAPAADGGSVLQRLGLRFFAPVGRVVDAGADGAASMVGSWRSRGTLLDENRDLERQVAEQRLEIMRLRELEDEVGRLAVALDHARSTPDVFRLAEVVYLDRSNWGSIAIVRSTAGDPRKDTPVVSPDGVVGRVVRVAAPFATVQLLTDRLSTVGAMVERTRRQGLVRGDGKGGLTLDEIPVQSEVKIGDRVLTAGIDGVYPAGIPIGEVIAVEPGSQIFHRIRVTPDVDFSALGEVFLLDHAQLPHALQSELNRDARP